MEGFDAATYGQRVAHRYDRIHRHLSAEPAVSLLASLAGEGPALELGVGTGRVAVPLAAAGVEVWGVDASPAMLEVLQAKPGGDSVKTSVADFAAIDLASTFALVYVVFNTFFSLLTQPAQCQCVAAVGRHLRPGGRFVIEAFVPDLAIFDRGQRVTVNAIDLDEVDMSVTRHDRAGQTVATQHIYLGPDRVELVPTVLRYAYPAELDLMAAMAGLELEWRWAGWDRAPFLGDSGGHVSVYRRPAE
ncbi:MAG TPA: class I SAM-dependent methyltransferase [Acidimicrobiales bacterium]|nr:class I SAM-dependent methyltransferase [Acidimicrobiales bacterium]